MNLCRAVLLVTRRVGGLLTHETARVLAFASVPVLRLCGGGYERNKLKNGAPKPTNPFSPPPGLATGSGGHRLGAGVCATRCEYNAIWPPQGDGCRIAGITIEADLIYSRASCFHPSSTTPPDLTASRSIAALKTNGRTTPMYEDTINLGPT